MTDLPVAVSQRVDIIANRDERRDALDQRVVQLLADCGCMAIPVPNRGANVRRYLDAVGAQAVVLTGGNDLVAYGGDAPERDLTEAKMIDWALGRGLPVFGICHGMQVLLHRAGVELVRVESHVTKSHALRMSNGRRRTANSYHNLAATAAAAAAGGLTPWATTDDGVVEAVVDKALPILGIMWHPEREAAFEAEDVDLIRRFLHGEPVSSLLECPPEDNTTTVVR